MAVGVPWGGTTTPPRRSLVIGWSWLIKSKLFYCAFSQKKHKLTIFNWRFREKFSNEPKGEIENERVDRLASESKDEQVNRVDCA